MPSEFHDAVFEAFEKLTEGNTEEALAIARKVAAVKVREELRAKHDHITDSAYAAWRNRQIKAPQFAHSQHKKSHKLGQF